MSELIGGLNTVLELLQGAGAGRVGELWLQDNRSDGRLAKLEALARRHGVTIHREPRRDLDRRLPGVRHQGVVARCEDLAPAAVPALEDLLTQSPAPLLLILDGVQDPHNLGACLRSAAAAGVDALIAPRDRAAGLTATARKVASGGAERVPFLQVTNLARTLREINDAGVFTVGLDGSGDGDLYDQDLRGPLALVMGAEGKGLRRLTREGCQALARIPMPGGMQSLNVAVAAGVALFEAVRQRRG